MQNQIATSSLAGGVFPALIAIITIFFAGSGGGASLLSAGGLVLILLFGVFVTFAVTAALSKTVLKGQSSSFTLEMPPYRAPQVGRVIVRSIFDRTLFVLGRAVCVAAPAGVVIWLLANVTVDGASLLNICAGAMDPFARLMGLDGVILLAFVLGFPANEIVIPIIIMAYSAQGTLTDVSDIAQMGQIFADNGWTWATAVSVLLFFLLHWPCSTTLITIKKETGSAKWTALAAVIPTVLGVAVCMMFTLAVRVLGLG